MLELPPSWVIVLAGCFGLLIGSFLNACIYRLPRDISIVHPRSHCPYCEKTIAWYDNLPLLSWLMLGGKCRHCRAPISFRYPLVEIVTGLLFAASFWRMGNSPDALKLCVFCALITGLVFMDFEERILADEFTVGGMILGFALSMFLPMPKFLAALVLPAEWRESYRSLAESLLGGLLPAVSLYVIGEIYYRVRGREGLGFGDVKMIAMVGAFYNLQAALLTLMIGSVAGSLLGLGFVVFTKKDAATYELPFGSFLGAAALIPPFVWPELSSGIVVPW
jgi:leader peptidase (prepilin peptidase) / N-methyltransferase